MSLKSVAYGIISFIVVSLLTIGLSFADEPFQPVMPTSNLYIMPSGITTGSTPIIIVGNGNPSPGYEVERSLDQIQIVISSSTTTYFDGWFSMGAHNTSSYHIPVNIPVGTEYVISVRGWNNNGFGEWVVSELNTVVPKGTDCHQNKRKRINNEWFTNPACQ